MRLGPLRARIVTHLGTARALLAQNRPNERETRSVKDKLERICETFEKLNYEWINTLESQSNQDYTNWENDYKGLAEGEGGFLKLIDDAKDVIGEISGLLDTITRPNLQNGANQTATHQAPNVRLPLAQLPVFSGKIVDWPAYWAIFESTVDKNNTYSESEKFSYLMMTLSIRQQEEIKGYQLTEGGYNLALQYLKSRYGNEQSIKRALYREIKDLTVAKRVEEVRRNWVTLNRVLLQLERLKEDTTSQSLLQDIEQKFHEWVLREVISEQVKSTGSWTPKNFLDVVDRITKVREITFDIGIPTRRTTIQQNTFVSQTDTRRADNRREQNTRAPKAQRPTTTTNLALNSSNNKRSCIFCNLTNHSSAHCRKFPTKDLKIRRLTELKKCLKCFGDGHFSRNCTAKIKCKQCGKEHYFAVCGERTDTVSPLNREQSHVVQNDVPTNEESESESNQEEHEFFVNENSYGVTNLTEEVHIEIPEDFFGIIFDRRISQTERAQNTYNTSEKTEKTRTVLAVKSIDFLTKTQTCERGLAFFDCGSTCSFISEGFAYKLGFWDHSQQHHKSMDVGGYGGKTSTFGTTQMRIGVKLKNGSTHGVLLNTSPNLDKMQVAYAFNQRDFRFDEEALVKIQVRAPDVLFGLIDMFTLTNKIEKISKNRFVLWMDIGPIICGRPKRIEFTRPHVGQSESQYSLECTESDHSNNDFWSLEIVGIRDKELITTDDEEAWKQFKESVTRLPDGRYEVGWPWRDTRRVISDNFGIAIGRLKSLQNRWKREKPEVLEECNRIITEQLETDIIEIAPAKTPFIISYLPHQAVIKDNSSFTKLRMVFDASAGKAPLNKELLRGEVLLPKVASILLRMRLPKYICVSDVAKAFLQLSLRLEDRDVTRFLWVKNTKEPPEGKNLIVYRFKRVPFGVISSPFLLIATIHHHLDNHEGERSLCNEIKSSLYMDNILVGASSPEEIISKYQKIKEIFASAKMNVREFCSNCEMANQNFDVKDKHPGTEKGQIKLLGIKWKFEEDEWEISFPKDSPENALTKRGTLAIIHSIFDPLGIISPILLEAKLFYQRICEQKKAWNDQLEEEEKLKFRQIVQKWGDQPCKFTRRINVESNNVSQLHCFVDASKEAYAAAVYIRVEQGERTTSNILFAKNRIVPLDKTKAKH